MRAKPGERKRGELKRGECADGRIDRGYGSIRVAPVCLWRQRRSLANRAETGFWCYPLTQGRVQVSGAGEEGGRPRDYRGMHCLAGQQWRLLTHFWGRVQDACESRSDSGNTPGGLPRSSLRSSLVPVITYCDTQELHVDLNCFHRLSHLHLLSLGSVQTLMCI